MGEIVPTPSEVRIDAAFRHAVARLAVSKIKKIGKENGLVGLDVLDLSEAYQRVLHLPRPVKLSLLRSRVLATRGSMSLFVVGNSPLPQDTEYELDSHLVQQGTNSEILANEKHFLWSMEVANSVYIDEELHLRSVGQRITIDSFVSNDSVILQVRAGSEIAKDVAAAYALKNGLNPEIAMMPLGIAHDKIEPLAARLNAAVVACSGKRITGDSFNTVRATKKKDVVDLSGSVDYQQFEDETDPLSRDLEFNCDGQKVTMRVGISSQNFVFITDVTEGVYRTVISCVRDLYGV